MPGQGGSAQTAGLVESGLLATMRRYLGAGRIVLVLATVALGVASVGPDQVPAAAGAGVMTLVCSAAGARMLTRNEFLSAAPTVASVLVVGIAQPWVGPPGGNGWAFATASITAICAQYEFAARPALAWGVSLVSVAAHITGASIGTGPGWTLPITTGVRMLLEIALSFGAVLLLRRWARTADLSHEQAAEQRRSARLAAARRAEEREYLATLHDTASTTLLMVSFGVDDRQAQWLPQRAADDLRRLAAPPITEGDDVDLIPLLRLASEHPDIQVLMSGPRTLVAPALIGLAVLHGIREAVQNVASHAGTTTAVLKARRDGDGFRIELTDCGHGFDPGQVGEHHRGINESVVGRMNAAGGQVQVISAPGIGTRICWLWHG